MARKKAMARSKAPCNLVPVFAYLAEVFAIAKSTELLTITSDAVKDILKMLEESKGLTHSVGHKISTVKAGRDVDFEGILAMLGEVTSSVPISTTYEVHNKECHEKPRTPAKNPGSVVEVVTVQRDIKLTATVHVISEERRLKSINSDLRFFAKRSPGRQLLDIGRGKDKMMLKLARNPDEPVAVWTDGRVFSAGFYESIPENIRSRLHGPLW